MGSLHKGDAGLPEGLSDETPDPRIGKAFLQEVECEIEAQKS